jgi:transketolase
MGHGLPAGLGMALARRIKGEPGNVFVLMGDGECQEGTTWESILLGAKLKLGNLVALVDSNGIQGSGYVDEILPVTHVLTETALAAGWRVIELDGHNDDLVKVDFTKTEKPTLIVAKTVKGKGVSFMENSPKWHSNWLGGELERQALEELS